MFEELITVLMPVYNVELYVEEAILSILSQSYSNFEFIIIDDCSTDSTYQICKKFALKDKRIKLYKNTVNSKIEKTLNLGLSKASGKYVVRMDGDDISDKDRLRVMKEFLDSHNDIALVGTSTNTIDSNGNYVSNNIYPFTQECVKKTLLLQTPVLHIWMTYKAIYDELNGYRVFNGSEDYDFVLRAISAGYNVSNIKDYYGYNVRINRNGNSNCVFGLNKIRSSMYVRKLYKERNKKFIDSYSINNMKKYITVSNFSNRLWKISNRNLYNAINAKRNKLYFKMLFYILFSMISPYQIMLYYKRIKYLLVMKKEF